MYSFFLQFFFLKRKYFYFICVFIFLVPLPCFVSPPHLSFFDWLICFLPACWSRSFPFNVRWTSSSDTSTLSSRERKKKRERLLERERERERDRKRVSDCDKKVSAWWVISVFWSSEAFWGLLWELILGGFLRGCFDLLWILIWVGVFLVLNHPTRREVVVVGWRRKCPTRSLSKKLQLLSLTTPAGLAQVWCQILKLSFMSCLWMGSFGFWVGFNCAEFCVLWLFFRYLWPFFIIQVVGKFDLVHLRLCFQC